MYNLRFRFGFARLGKDRYMQRLFEVDGVGHGWRTRSRELQKRTNDKRQLKKRVDNILQT